MNIRDNEGLKDFWEPLENLGFSGSESVEQLKYAIQATGREMASYLGVSSSTLNQKIDTVQSVASIPETAIDIITSSLYPLGVEIDLIPQSQVAPPATTITIPMLTEINHIEDMPKIQDQGKRGTCVAHAALSIYEHYLLKEAAFHKLSEQFLYWNCKKNDSIPNQSGTWLAVAMPILHREGCCTEAKWSYSTEPIVGNEGQGPPPSGAQSNAMIYRPDSYKQLSPTSVDDIKGELGKGHCVAFSIPVFNSWLRSEWVALKGDITMPIPNEFRSGGHAMCLVGYKDLSDRGLGGGRFILRNSWGSNWGIESEYGAGYGTIPYAYIAKMGKEAYSLS